MPCHGEIRVGVASDYEKGDGFVIEMFHDRRDGSSGWAIPDWTERGMPDYDQIFQTAFAARHAIVSGTCP